MWIKTVSIQFQCLTYVIITIKHTSDWDWPRNRCLLYIIYKTNIVPTILIKHTSYQLEQHIDGLVQDCSIAITNALATLQSCTEPSMLSFSCAIHGHMKLWLIDWICMISFRQHCDFGSQASNIYETLVWFVWKPICVTCRCFFNQVTILIK